MCFSYMILGEVPHVVYMATIRQFQETTTTHKALQKKSWVPFHKSKTSQKKKRWAVFLPSFWILGFFSLHSSRFSCISVFCWLSSHCKKRGRQVKSRHIASFEYGTCRWSADSKTARRRKCRTYSIAGWRIIPFYVSILDSYIFIHGGFPIDMSWFRDSRSVVQGYGWRGQGKLDMGIRRTVRMRRMRKAGNESWRWRRTSWSLQNTLLLFVSLEGWVQPNGRLSSVLFRLKFWYAPEQLQHEVEDVKCLEMYAWWRVKKFSLPVAPDLYTCLGTCRCWHLHLETQIKIQTSQEHDQMGWHSLRGKLWTLNYQRKFANGQDPKPFARDFQDRIACLHCIGKSAEIENVNSPRRLQGKLCREKGA